MENCVFDCRLKLSQENWDEQHEKKIFKSLNCLRITVWEQIAYETQKTCSCRPRCGTRGHRQKLKQPLLVSIRLQFPEGSCKESLLFCRKLLGKTHMHTCIEKVSCDTFFGIFKAIKPHQANTAMCDQHSCSAAAPHAAAKHQQLKASWGVTAETQANRKRGKDSQNKPEDMNTKYLKSSDESWTWQLHLPAAQNTQFF